MANKKIIILNGSPQKDGPVSDLVNAFTQGAQSRGAQVTEFFLQDMNIHWCTGCFKGNSELENPCTTIDDDMKKIYPVFKQSDVIVLASPVFFWMVSAQLKTAIDRLVALEEGKDLLHGEDRSAALLMSSDGSASQFDQSFAWYQHLLERYRWRNIGSSFATGDSHSSNPENALVMENTVALGERAASDHHFL